ncbi:MAG: transporter substrate-binding domain-containing protein [Pseudomonadota bacterium]
MKSTRSGLVLLALAVAAQLSVSAQTHTLKIATGELPPYMTAARADQGISLNVVRRAFELAGYQVEYVFLPWSRALAETRLGKWDATAAWGNNPERNPPFFVSDNVVTEKWVFVYRNAVKFSWSTLADLKPYRVAMIQDYTYTPEMWAMANAGDFKSDKMPNDAAAIKMLLLDRVDVVPMERNVACDVLQKNFTDADAAKLSVDPKQMTDTFTSHVLLPRSLADSATRAADFNAGLKKLKASPEYAKILSQVKCPSGWSGAAGK